MTSHSEVAKIRAAIQQEREATQQGLSGLSSLARHESIHARAARMHAFHDKLTKQVGRTEASTMLLETEAQILDRRERSTWSPLERPTLGQVRRDKGLQSRQLAEAAGLPLRIAYQAEIGILVDEEDAQKLLHALSYLTGETYTLANVAINLKPEMLR